MLALAAGLLQLALLAPLGSSVLRAAGIDPTSSVWQPARVVLWVRGLGAPITAALLVSQGIFRGLKDTKSPLKAGICIRPETDLACLLMEVLG